MAYLKRDFYVSGVEKMYPTALHFASGAHTEPQFFCKFRRRHWVLDYYPRGGFRFIAGEKMDDFAVRPASALHLYPPETEFQEDFRGAAMPQPCCWMIFRGGEALGLEKLCDNGYGFAEIIDLRKAVEPLLLAGAYAVDNCRGSGYLEAQKALYGIAAELNDARSSPGEAGYLFDLGGAQAAAESERQWLSVAQSLLRREMTRPLDIGKLAEKMKCSKSGFSHRYRQLAGEPPGRTLLKMRINAAFLLLEDNFPLRQIARETGFYDEYHFSRVFKRLTGATPTEHRQRRSG